MKKVFVWTADFFRRHKRIRNVCCTASVLALFLLALAIFANIVVAVRGGNVTDDPKMIPPESIALVLGTSRMTSYGENLYFKSRIDAAAALYRTGRLKRIIVSGDNSVKDYDEATDMKTALVERGVPPEIIFCDYAGFRTLDSVVRAKKIFGVEKLVVISQRFHCVRAVYIASAHGISACGFAARDVNYKTFRVKMACREFLARPMAWADINIFRRSPKFLGEKISL